MFTHLGRWETMDAAGTIINYDFSIDTHASFLSVDNFLGVRYIYYKR